MLYWGNVDAVNKRRLIGHSNLRITNALVTYICVTLKAIPLFQGQLLQRLIKVKKSLKINYSVGLYLEALFMFPMWIL